MTLSLSALHPGFRWALVLTIATTLITLIFIWQLPLEIPLLFSRLEGKSQLVPSNWLLLPLILNLACLLINALIAAKLKILPPKTRKNKNTDYVSLINQAVTETMARSLNNSLTIIFMLLALILLGGQTIRWFVFALLIGTISGTYSSPFVATPILYWLKKFKKK